ncbi:MAG TPA: ABC transporter permease subunit [Micropepsaceae bacterium]|nr:ABC transporter permease subunit [Micropepsaceae bacterium]
MKNWLGPALAAPATLWLLAAFAAPFFIVALMAVQPESDPFAPLVFIPSATQFRAIFEDNFYFSVLLKTTALAIGVCAATTVLAYPLALWIVSLAPKWRPLAMSAVLVPLLINVVVRSLGIELLLAPDGLINAVLATLGLPRSSNMLYNYGAIAVGLVQVFLPFMVLALYDVLQATSPRVLEAARSLGASRAVQFFSVELPMSLPGLRAGLTFVFLMASTTYVSARMLGGKKAFTTGMLVWQEVLENLNGQFAAALALVMTLIAIVAAALIALGMGRLTPWLVFRPARAWSMPRWVAAVLDVIVPPLAYVLIAIAFVLLLLPLALVFIQSFNDVPQATMAGFRAFTLRWYRQLFDTGLYFDSFWVSLQLAAVTSVVTVVLATAAAFALVRTRFSGKPIVAAFWMFPLSLPQVAIGIGMLRLLQIVTALPAFLALLAVHVTITLPFCIGLLRASVQQLDRAQEEAASSLGAGPVRNFFHVILPGLAPGLAAAAIVALLLSFEEVTITSFLTTARMTTLPVRIYAEASYSLEPTVYAISTLMIAMTVVAMFVLGRLVRLDRVFSR